MVSLMAMRELDGTTGWRRRAEGVSKVSIYMIAELV